MAPLTSSSGCDSCAHLADKIVELERRISTLYQIRESEKYMDTIVFGPAHNDTAAGSASPPINEPVTTAHCPVAEVVHPPVTDLVAVADPPVMEPNKSWVRLGARPKVPVSSTPSHHEPWTLVGVRTGGKGCPAPAPPSYGIQLENKYDILSQHDFPPLPPPLISHGSYSSLSPPIPPPVRPVRSSRIRTRHSIPQFTPAPRGRPTSLAANHSPSSRSSRPQLPPSTTPPPTTLIIGDSIVRNIRRKSAATFCFPGAKVSDIMVIIPSILADHPYARNVVLHIGCNDIPSRTSEILKRDFTKLLDSLVHKGIRLFVSGPLPPLGRGVGRFSRTLSLHTWLQLTCTARNIAFVDNFNLFWNRPAFFRRDGIHPNGLGSRILTDNLFYTVWTSPVH